MTSNNKDDVRLPFDVIISRNVMNKHGNFSMADFRRLRFVRYIDKGISNYFYDRIGMHCSF